MFANNEFGMKLRGLESIAGQSFRAAKSGP